MKNFICQGLTGIRVGIVLQSISAVVLGLALGFTASWKITLVILSFSPLILLLGQTGSKKGIQDKKSKNKDSFIEQGGQVGKRRNGFLPTKSSMRIFSMLYKRSNKFVLL